MFNFTIMKKTATKEIVARINEINGVLSTKLHGKTYEKLNEFYTELGDIAQEYNLFDSPFEENGKMGVKDITGKVRVPALYKEYPVLYSYHTLRNLPIVARNFNDKVALVASDGTGRALCDFEYNLIYIEFGAEGFFVCVKEDGDNYIKGVLNSKGELVVPCEMDSVSEMINNNSVIEKDGKIGFLIGDGTFIAPQYDDYDDENGVLKVLKDGVWGYISADYEFIPEEDDERMEKIVLLGLYES